jgi:hypothetical protein
MEPAVQAAVRAWLGGTLPPWAAHSAEAHVVGDVISEHALGDEPRWAIIKISPVPPARAANQIGIKVIAVAEKKRKCTYQLLLLLSGGQGRSVTVRHEKHHPSSRLAKCLLLRARQNRWESSLR